MLTLKFLLGDVINEYENKCVKCIVENCEICEYESLHLC